MRENEKNRKWEYPPAIALGVIGGGIFGLVGGVVYEMLEWPLTGMNHYSFVGAFSGLAVALFFNYTVRLDLN
jgi:hypothetical protein